MCYFCGNSYAYYLSLITKTTHGLQRSRVNLWVEQFTRFGCFCWINVMMEEKKILRCWDTKQSLVTQKGLRKAHNFSYYFCVQGEHGHGTLLRHELLRFLVKDTRLNGLFKIIYGITCKRFERFRSPCTQFGSLLTKDLALFTPRLVS